MGLRRVTPPPAATTAASWALTSPTCPCSPAPRPSPAAREDSPGTMLRSTLTRSLQASSQDRSLSEGRRPSTTRWTPTAARMTPRKRLTPLLPCSGLRRAPQPRIRSRRHLRRRSCRPRRPASLRSRRRPACPTTATRPTPPPPPPLRPAATTTAAAAAAAAAAAVKPRGLCRVRQPLPACCAHIAM
jgi:hypothetical protein